MPRVRHTLKGKEVIQAWLEQSQDWAKTSSGGVSFKGPYLFDRDFSELEESDYPDYACGIRWVMQNGDVVFTYSGLPSHRSYCPGGYNGRDLLREYCVKHNAYKYDCCYKRSIFQACTYNIRVWVCSASCNNPTDIALRVRDEVDDLLDARRNIRRWNVTRNEEGFDDKMKACSSVIYDDKVTMELIKKAIGFHPHEMTIKAYDDKYGVGKLDKAVRYAICDVAKCYGLEIVGAYPFATDGRKVKLSVAPRVK